MSKLMVFTADYGSIRDSQGPHRLINLLSSVAEPLDKECAPQIILGHVPNSADSTVPPWLYCCEYTVYLYLMQIVDELQLRGELENLQDEENPVSKLFVCLT